MKKSILFALSALAAAGAFARENGYQRERVADPDAGVPPSEYRSAFEDYRPYQDQALAPWREVNDEVARVGGHVGVLKGSSPSEESTPGKEQEKANPDHGHGGGR